MFFFCFRRAEVGKIPPHFFIGVVELELGEGVDVEEVRDGGASVGRLHGVVVDVEEGGVGAIEGSLHGVMFMGF